MLVKIITKFTLDSKNLQGKKNLELLLVAAGLRSQVDIRSITKLDSGWEVVLYLERPEYWGRDLEFLREDIESLVIYHQNSPTSCQGLVDFSQKTINTACDFGEIDDSVDDD